MRNSPAGERFFKKSEIYQQKANLKTAEGQTVREKYELMDRTLESPGNNLSVSALCDTAGVSRSGFLFMEETKKAVRPQILLNWSVDTYDINYIITYSSILKEKTVNV